MNKWLPFFLYCPSYLKLKFLPLGVSFDDSSGGVCSREHVFLDFKMIGISTNTTLALVLIPLSTNCAAVLLIHCPLFPTRRESILPTSIPCWRIPDIPVANGLVYHTTKYENCAESFEGHGIGVRDVWFQERSVMNRYIRDRQAMVLSSQPFDVPSKDITQMVYYRINILLYPMRRLPHKYLPSQWIQTDLL